MVERENEDFQLIDSFLNDNHSAFDQLMLKYQRSVFNICFKILGNAEDATDCAQETFIKVYKALVDFRFKAQFTTWLYRIAVNTCKNKLTSAEYRNRHKMIAIESSNQQQGQWVSYFSDNFQTPERIVEKKADMELIMNAISALPDQQKILIILSDVEGQSYQEIAKITGLRLGTVKSRLARARHLLRGKLEGAINL